MLFNKGIGWFKCKCGRKYAGFSRGDVMSKCHGCQTKNLPLFIVSGNEASKREHSNNSHHCELCKGNSGSCPIVHAAKD